jgi:hypothetical protein
MKRIRPPRGSVIALKRLTIEPKGGIHLTGKELILAPFAILDKSAHKNLEATIRVSQ